MRVVSRPKFGARALVKTDALKTNRLGRNHNFVLIFFKLLFIISIQVELYR